MCWSRAVKLMGRRHSSLIEGVDDDDHAEGLVVERKLSVVDKHDGFTNAVSDGVCGIFGGNRGFPASTQRAQMCTDHAVAGTDFQALEIIRISR